MQNTHLSKLLSTIDKNEMRAFGHYLKGIHSGSKQIHKVHEYLTNSHTDYEAKRMARSKVIKYVFDKDVNEKALSNLYSTLASYLEDFLAIEEMKSNTFIQDYLLIKRFARQNKSELLKKAILRAEKNEVEDQKKNGLELFSFLRKLQISYWAYYGIEDDTIIKDKEALLNIIYNLDLFCKGSKLKFDIELTNRYNILDECSQDKAVMTSFNDNTDAVVLVLYQMVGDLFNKFESSRLNDFSELFFQYHQYLHVNEKLVLYSYLLNLAIKGVRQDSDLIHKTFSIIKLGNVNNFFLDKRFLSSTRIQNTVTIASYLEDYDWLAKFFKKHNLDKNNDYLESISEVIKAQICFSKGEYKQVLNLLEEIKFKNTFFEMSRRHLIIRSYYDSEKDIDVMLDFCRAYERFIKYKKELSTRIIEASLAFTKMFKSIIKGKHTKIELLQLVNSTEHLHYRDWLLKKIEELPK